MTDYKKRTAHWRIDRLPKSVHVAGDTSTAGGSFQSGNVAITGEALRYTTGPRIETRLYSRLTHAQQHWDIVLNETRGEWEAPGIPDNVGGALLPITELGKPDTGGWPPDASGIFNPYVDEYRYANVSGKIRQYALRQETVMFRGLPISALVSQPAGKSGHNTTSGSICNRPRSR